MLKFNDIKSGFFIGIANVIPGVSGGTMAVIFNVYEKLVSEISRIFKTPVQVIQNLSFIIIGMIIGIVAGVFGVDYGYKHFPLVTTLFFIGLILGGIKPIYLPIKSVIHHKMIYVWMILFFVIVAFMPLLKTGAGIQSGFIYYIMLFIMGIVTAIAMIAPGISGSLVLLLFGYYAEILGLAKNSIDALIHLDFNALFQLVIPVLLFVLGFMIGAVLFSKVIVYILKHYEKVFYSAVFGMLLGSPIAILLLLNETQLLTSFSVFEYIVAFITLIGGAYLSYVLSFHEN